MEIKDVCRNVRIVMGLILGIAAIIANINGTIIGDDTIQLVIISTFAIILIDAPKEN